MWIALAIAAIFAAIVGGSALYLMTLLVAALRHRPSCAASLAQSSDRTPDTARRPTRFTAVIPAHDEELVLAQTLESIQKVVYPPGCLKIAVIADNCTDQTASIARSCGVDVLERTNPDERGKGYALAWAFSRLLAPDDTAFDRDAEAFVVIDADTQVAADFFARMDDALVARGADGDAGKMSVAVALQGRYGVANPHEGWRASLMQAAFDLVNHVRLLGAETLCAYVGLKGNGMVFTRALMQTARWSGASITEDIDFGLHLLTDLKIRAQYTPDAVVRAQMPVSARASRSQRERWERGRAELARRRVPVLFKAALRQRSFVLASAAIDLWVPPLAELSALWCLWLCWTVIADRLVGWGSFREVAWGALIVTGASLVLYVLVGLRLAGATGPTYVALLRAPFFIVWKLLLRLWRALHPDRHDAPLWVRTERVAPHGAAAAPPAETDSSPDSSSSSSAHVAKGKQ